MLDVFVWLCDAQSDMSWNCGRNSKQRVSSDGSAVDFGLKDPEIETRWILWDSFKLKPYCLLQHVIINNHEKCKKCKKCGEIAQMVEQWLEIGRLGGPGFESSNGLQISGFGLSDIRTFGLSPVPLPLPCCSVLLVIMPVSAGRQENSKKRYLQSDL